MAIVINGSTKEITLSVDTVFAFHDIYVTIVDWSAQSSNMQFLLPCSGNGKITLGTSVYTDSIYTLLNGWKLKPSGYSEGDQIQITGTVVTDDSSARTKPQTVGECPVWIFTVATNGIIAESGGGGGASWDTILVGQDFPSGSAGDVLVNVPKLIARKGDL